MCLHINGLKQTAGFGTFLTAKSIIAGGSNDTTDWRAVNGYDSILQYYEVIATFDRRRREYKKLGWIYAARNRSFVDRVFKVGQSARPPHVRVEELSSNTAVYQDFELVYFVHVGNRDPAEGQAHYRLQDYQINSRKEFFQAPLQTVVGVLDQVANMFPIPLGKTPRAGFLNQPLSPYLTRCSGCGSRNRVPNVLIELMITCVSCREQFEIAPDRY